MKPGDNVTLSFNQGRLMTDSNQLLDQFIKQYLSVPLHQHLQLSLEAFEHGRVTVKFPMREELIGNPYTQILHGGTLAAALDAVSGLCAALSVFNKQPELTLEVMTALIRDISTTNLQINYLRPGSGQYFDIEAKTIRSGRRLTVVESRCHDNQNRLIASCSAQFITG